MAMQSTTKAAPKDSVLALRLSDKVFGKHLTLQLRPGTESPAQDDLAGDLFWSLVKADPIVKDKVSTERELNKVLLQWIAKNPQFGVLRQSTVGDHLASAVSAELMFTALSDDRVVQEALAEQKKIDDLLKQSTEAAQQAQAAKKDGDDKQAAQFSALSTLLGQQAKDQAQAAAAKLATKTDNPLSGGAVTAAAKQAQGAANDAKDFADGWSQGGDENEPSGTDVNAALDVMRKYGDKLKAIIQNIGRAKGAARKGVEYAKKSGIKRTHVGLTKSPRHLFPSELAKMTVPGVYGLSNKVAFVQHGLLGWLEADEGGTKQGSVVFAVDKSGSMNGEPEQIANGMALGFCHAMRTASDKVSRRYTCFGFSDRRDKFDKVTDQDDWKKHLDWAGYSPHGGTDFDNALSHAIKVLKQMAAAGIKDADLVMLTDGEALVSDDLQAEWKQFAQDTGARFIALIIQRSGDSPDNNLDKVANLVLNVQADSESLDRVTQALARFVMEHELDERAAGD